MAITLPVSAEATIASITSMPNLTHTGAIESGRQAYAMAGMKPSDIDVLELYDAFTLNTILFLEDLGFCPKGEGGRFVEGGRIGPKGSLPVITNGGGLSYAHSGMYGMFALQESVRQMRGTAPAQIPGAKISVCHGVGGMFAASGTIIFSNEAP